MAASSAAPARPSIRLREGADKGDEIKKLRDEMDKLSEDNRALKDRLDKLEATNGAKPSPRSTPRTRASTNGGRPATKRTAVTSRRR